MSYKDLQDGTESFLYTLSQSKRVLLQENSQSGLKQPFPLPDPDS